MMCGVAARDQDAAGANRVAFLGFADAKIAALIEAICKRSGKQLRHVLHDEDGKGKSMRNCGKENIKGGGTTGGDANDNHGGRRRSAD